MNANFPKLAQSGHKGRNESNFKRAYIAWDDNEVSSSFDSKSEEYKNLDLKASHHSDHDEEEVSNEISYYDNDAQGAIYELLN